MAKSRVHGEWMKIPILIWGGIWDLCALDDMGHCVRKGLATRGGDVG